MVLTICSLKKENNKKQKHTAHQFSIAIYQLTTSIVIIGINIKSHVAEILMIIIGIMIFAIIE